jgi:hypothetical protein
LDVETHPLPWEYPFNAKPLFQELPNSNDEVVMDEKVIVVFFCLLAKWAKITIFPTMLPQPIRRPKSIFPDQPSVILDFRRSPSFLYQIVNGRLNKAKKLQLAWGSRGVLPIARKLPPNIILHVLIKMQILYEDPCLHKLCEMLNRYGSINAHFLIHSSS